MAIIVNDNFSINTGKPVDSKYLNISTPWNSVNQANNNIPLSYRYTGLTVNILGSEYWYRTGITDSHLVLKSFGGGITTATNGLKLNNDGTIISLGGTLTGDTIFDGTASKYVLKYGGNYHTSYDGNTLVDKNYVDSIANGIVAKEPVLVATTGSITLSGLTTIDGVTLSGGNRILVKDQVDKTTNGIYSANTGNWGRTADFDGSPSGEVVSGSYVFVLSGDSNAYSSWVLTTSNPITVGISDLEFVLYDKTKNVNAGVGINITTGTNGYVVNFDGGNVVGSCLTWSGNKINLNDFSKNVISSAITGVTNGITKNNAIIGLGGKLLTGSTCIGICHNAGTTLLVGNGTNDVDWTGGRLKISRCSGINCNYSYIGSRYDSDNCTEIKLIANDGICFNRIAGGVDRSLKLAGQGLIYGADYSAYYTDRSLVDKEYVDNASGGIGADNGLSRVGSNIVLGGSLSGNTTILGNTKNLSIGKQNSKIKSFEIYTTGLTINSSATTYNDINSVKRGIQYGADYSANYTNRSLVDKQYVTNAIGGFSTSNCFTSDITVYLSNGKSFGKYCNGCTIPSTNKTPKEVILMALDEPLTPTVGLSVVSSVLSFGKPDKQIELNISRIANSKNSTISGATLWYSRGGSYIPLFTDNPIPQYYNHEFIDSNRFCNVDICYKYCAYDSCGATGCTDIIVTLEQYAAPTYIQQYIPNLGLRSYETASIREAGNIQTVISGCSTINRNNVKLTGYSYNMSINNSPYTTIYSYNTDSYGSDSMYFSCCKDNSAPKDTTTSIAYYTDIKDQYTINATPICNICFRFGSLYGCSTSDNLESLTPSEIYNCFRNTVSLLSSVSRTITDISTNNDQYFYILYPYNFGNIGSIIMDGASQISGAFIGQDARNVTNDYGATSSYRIYRTNAKKPFTSNSIVIS